MNSMIQMENVSFSYSDSSGKSLADVSLTVEKGDFLLLTGATGCGKSTLLKTINGLIPHESGGILTGSVVVDGHNVMEQSVAQLSKTAGMVFQSPEDQIFSTSVYDEAAFVLENQNVPLQEIELRVKKVLDTVGLGSFYKRSVHALSGGQKQRLALAATLVANPKILLLDEPISQLDPQGASDLLNVVSSLNEAGITIVIVEHRLHEVMPICKHVAVMDAGRLAWYGSQQEAFDSLHVFQRYGLRMPHTIELCSALDIKPADASVETTVQCIRERFSITERHSACPCPPSARLVSDNGGEPLAEIKDASFRYDDNGANILDKLDLKIYRGEFVAIMGRNGAGKSTLLQLVSGLTRSSTGEVLVAGAVKDKIDQHVGFVMQNPDLMLFNISVEQEIEFAMRQQKESARVEPAFIQAMGLAGLEQRFPLSLSRGQRFRVAIAAALAAEPKLLLLDEPTTGQDIAHIHEVMNLLGKYIKEGGTVIFCTHDAEVVAAYASRVVVMRGGKIIGDGKPRVIFSQSAMLESTGVKIPQIAELSQSLYGECSLTVEEAANRVKHIHVGSPTE